MNLFNRKRFWIALAASNLYTAVWVGIGLLNQKGESWWVYGTIPIGIAALYFALYDHYVSTRSGSKLEVHLVELESHMQKMERAIRGIDAVGSRLRDVTDRLEQEWLESKDAPTREAEIG